MKSRNKKNEFVPWEEECLKKKPETHEGIPPLTSIKSRVHSKPKSEDQEYLDMYILLKQKERIEKYGKTLGKQHRNVASSWKDLKRELLKREKELPRVTKDREEEGKGRASKEPRKTKKIPGNVKTFDWDY